MTTRRRRRRGLLARLVEWIRGRFRKPERWDPPDFGSFVAPSHNCMIRPLVPREERAARALQSGRRSWWERERW